MRVALRSNIGPRRANVPNTQPSAQIVFLPAPTEGWDTETPVEELPKTRAHVFDNWIPRGTSLEMREGFTVHVASADIRAIESGDVRVTEDGEIRVTEGYSVAPVETLMAYNAGLSSALFAAMGANIYNASSPGAYGAAVVSSLTSARFSYVNFTTAGGSFLWICNGLDNPRHWNGTAWATPSLTITTYTDNDINYVAAFKERLFFIFKNTLTMGYLPVQNIAGTVSNFPLGAVFRYGGRLMALGSLSRDGGDGLDDYLVILTSEGEIAVYQGIDPSDADLWSLVGVYYVGEPVGDRPIVELGGDLGVITQNGLISVAKTMMGAPEPQRDLFARVATPFRAAIATGQSHSGWEGLLVPTENLLIVNAPTTTETAEQYIRHHTTGGPGRFTGWNFETFEIFGGDCYAGTSDGRVVLCFSGHDDDGEDITAALSTAWTTLGAPLSKTLLEARAMVTTATRAVMRLVGRGDFRESPPLPAWPLGTVTNALIWGVGIWGSALWGGEDSTTRQWRAISGEGHNVQLVIEARSNQSRFAFNGFDLRFKIGGQV